MFISRNFNRTESDDFKLNVEHHIRDNKEAVPVFNDVSLDQTLEPHIVGWVIQNMYE